MAAKKSRKLTRTRALIAAALMTMGALVWLAHAAAPQPQQTGKVTKVETP